jgi:hypothetical protein
MTSQRILTVMMATALLSSAALAQNVEQKSPPPSGNTSTTKPADEGPRPLLTNVQVDLTVTDAMGSGPGQKKTVSLRIADGRMGRVRSSREASTAVLNVDAVPTIIDGQIRLQLTLEYSPPLSMDAPTRLAHLNEMVMLMLQSGKPTLVSQSSDPAADRKVSVEVTATILK